MIIFGSSDGIGTFPDVCAFQRVLACGSLSAAARDLGVDLNEAAREQRRRSAGLGDRRAGGDAQVRSRRRSGSRVSVAHLQTSGLCLRPSPPTYSQLEFEHQSTAGGILNSKASRNTSDIAAVLS